SLVRVVLQKIKRVGIWRGAAERPSRVTCTGVLDLDHVGAKPGQRLCARRTGLELAQIEDLETSKIIFSAHRWTLATVLGSLGCGTLAHLARGDLLGFSSSEGYSSRVLVAHIPPVHGNPEADRV